MTVLDVVSILVVATNWFVLGYFVALNTSYLVLIALAVREFRHHLRRRPWADLDDAYADPLTLGVSVVMPAYDEEATIVESVRAMLSLQHPRFEVVVVVDDPHPGHRLGDDFEPRGRGRVRQGDLEPGSGPDAVGLADRPGVEVHVAGRRELGRLRP